MRDLWKWVTDLHDRAWMWNGWVAIKWPVWAVITVLMVGIIWKMETVPNYDKIMIKRAKQAVSYPLKVLSGVRFQPSDKVKNLDQGLRFQ